VYDKFLFSRQRDSRGYLLVLGVIKEIIGITLGNYFGRSPYIIENLIAQMDLDDHSSIVDETYFLEKIRLKFFSKKS
jgi:hypothetical protein